MLKPEEAAQIIFSSIPIADKEVLLSTLLMEREAAIGVAATFYAAMTLAIMKPGVMTPDAVAEQTKLLITAANDNKGLIEQSKLMAAKFVESRLKGVS